LGAPQGKGNTPRMNRPTPKPIPPAPRGPDARPALSVVVPAYNEQDVLPAFQARIVPVMEAIGLPFEIVYVNDGSRDATLEIMLGLQAADPRVAVVNLSRNFGKEIALTAGLDHAAATEAVVVIDADLQDPPEVIPDLVAAWRRGFDIAYAQRRVREGETWLKVATANAFYGLMQRIGGRVQLPPNTGDFRLMSRRSLDALLTMREQHRFMKGLFAWVGFERTTIFYDREPRAAGTSKWHYWKLWNFALEGITGFSVAPLKVASYVGMLTALMAFTYAAYVLVKTLVSGDPVPGFPTLIVVISFLGGLQLMAIGILGEYVGRLFLETKRRPLYVIEDFQAPDLRAGVRLRSG
jgi:glycosyltransferase involved in cell wall biosynthesis